MGEFIRDENAAGDMQLAWWKPGMERHALAKQNPSDANFPAWISEEVRRAPEGMILFFVMTTTDIF